MAGIPNPGRGYSPGQERSTALGNIGPFQVTATIPSTATGANGAVTVTIPAKLGLIPGDVLFVIPLGAALVAGVDIEALVLSNTSLSLVAHNGSGGAFNPGAATYTLVGWRCNLNI